MKLALTRLAFRPDGVCGVLLARDDDGYLPLCVTLEDPWKQNLTGVSCIPAGLYRCRRHSSARYPDTFVVMDVPGRTGILLHAGNTHRDTQGCILIGRDWGTIDGNLGIFNSAAAFKDLLRWLASGGVDEFDLEIVDAFGGSTGPLH